MPLRTGMNRLEKCIKSGHLDLTTVKNIWELDTRLYEYESSTDNEDNDSSSDEEEKD